MEINFRIKLKFPPPEGRLLAAPVCGCGGGGAAPIAPSIQPSIDVWLHAFCRKGVCPSLRRPLCRSADPTQLVHVHVLLLLLLQSRDDPWVHSRSMLARSLGSLSLFTRAALSGCAVNTGDFLVMFAVRGYMLPCLFILPSVVLVRSAASTLPQHSRGK